MPNKDAVIRALRGFAHQLRGTLKVYRDSDACKTTAASIAAIADKAADVADVLERNGISQVDGSIARSMHDEAEQVDQIANYSLDESYGESLKVASVGLMSFVLRYFPVATSEGLRFQD